MFRTMKFILLITGIIIQFAAVIMFGFTEADVSEYTYLVVWILCGALIKYSAESLKAN